MAWRRSLREADVLLLCSFVRVALAPLAKKLGYRDMGMCFVASRTLALALRSLGENARMVVGSHCDFDGCRGCHGWVLWWARGRATALVVDPTFGQYLENMPVYLAAAPWMHVDYEEHMTEEEAIADVDSTFDQSPSQHEESIRVAVGESVSSYLTSLACGASVAA